MTVGIVGATGAVGKEMVRVLEDRAFPLETLRLFASARSAGTVVKTTFGEVTIEEFAVEKAQECDIVLLAVSGSFAKEHAKAIAEKAIVIDNSSAFRYEDDVPLIVPEVNPEALGDTTLISNPNCTTAIAAVALWPLHRTFGLQKVIVSTYQATSGGGQAAMDELESESKKYLAGEEVSNENFTHPIPFNLIPHIDAFQDNAYTKEEMKVTWETRKIFGLPELPVSCTAVRIPTFRAHAESITVETEKEITPDAARAVLEKAPCVEVTDTPGEHHYPMPRSASEKYDVEVGRIRQSLVFGQHGIDLFVCGDQLLKGAALNAVQIAELVVQK